MTNSKTEFKAIGEFLLQENKTFVIPNYQRGYKWAVKEEGKNETAVEKLMDDLINADKNQQYFLQGVTVSEEKEEIVLIDGQQRTTTLYLILWCLDPSNIEKINLRYDIREKSKEFIEKLRNHNFDYQSFDKEEKYQDIYYFKKAIEQIKEKLKGLNDKNTFKEFLLNKITILYIIIDPEKATKTFTMMNGSKASMLPEELVKAEILRRISLPETKEKIVSTSVDDNLLELKGIITQDWETNALRSRYAREWDKWLYWWNRQEVRDFFGVKNPMGLLLKYYYWIKLNGNNQKKEEKFSFEGFKALLIDNGNNQKQKTKLAFKELRDLQKSFEDILKKPKVHNYLKMSLLCSTSKEDKYDIVKYFMSKKNEDKLTDDYAKWRLVGATHKEITDPENNNSKESKKEKAFRVLKLLSQQYLYWDENDEDFDDGRKEMAYKQLLRLNVEMDNALNRRFDFSIWKNRSLEHIYPKSKKDEINWSGNNRISIHCIGNLVLLYGSNNSSFGAESVPDKKKAFFNIQKEDVAFQSRHLLHTISVFASDDWGIKEIKNNQDKFISRFEEDYNITLNDNER